MRLIFFSSAGDSFGNVITPAETHMSGIERDIISLSCSYSSANSLLWYRQYPGSAPEFLCAILHANGEVLRKANIVDQDPRFSAKMNENKTHVNLEIFSVLQCSGVHSDRKTNCTVQIPHLLYCGKTLKHLAYRFFHRNLEGLPFNMKNTKKHEKTYMLI